MSIPPAFTFYDKIYRTGGVFEPSHRLNLVNQTIQVNKNENFKVRFPNIWDKYKLPQVKKPEIYDNWLANQMMFWQNQLNFAVWCATTGCGVSKNNHLNHENPLIKSFFTFHVYYQIRRILSEIKCSLPTSKYWDAYDNEYDADVFEKNCNEFNIPTNTNFRQKLDDWNGAGQVIFNEENKKIYRKHPGHSKAFRTGTVPKKIDIETFTAETSGKYYDLLGIGPKSLSKGRFLIVLEQTFHKESGTADMSPDGSSMSAICSFILDESYGFTQAGIVRINDSIRTYVWAILGAQAQARSEIVGKSTSFGVQKQFLVLVENAINSAVDMESSIERYRTNLQYARSKLDFVLGVDLYMTPSDMVLHIDTINGYNNLLEVAESDIENLQLGQNNNINDEPAIIQETFQTPPDDFDEATPDEAIPDEPKISQDDIFQDNIFQDQLTHDETKLAITLSGVIIGSFLIWYLKS